MHISWRHHLPAVDLTKKQPIFLPAFNFLHIFAGFDLAIVSLIATTGLGDI